MRWLKHLSLAHADEAVAYILEEYGAEAYGVWWLILEDVAAPMETGKMVPISCHSAVKWSQICHCSVRRFRSIAGRLAEKNLINVQTDIDRIRIEVPNVLKYRDEYSQRSGQTPDQEQIQIENRKKDIPSDDILNWFESDFWPIFPRREAKAPGLKAARAVLKTAQLREVALKGLKSQLAVLNNREPKMRPLPATWINGRRWEDEPEPLFSKSNGSSTEDPWSNLPEYHHKDHMPNE